MGLKPFRGNTQGPIEEFLRQVYRWSLTIGSSVVDSVARAAAAAAQASADAAQADVDAAEADIINLQADVADHETRIDALEADEVAFKTTTYEGTVSNPNQASGATSYHRPIGEVTSTLTLTRGQVGWGRTGTIKNFRVRNIVATGDTETKTWTVNINGSDTALTVGPIAGTDTAWHRDTSNSASITAEDLLTIKAVNQVSGTGVVHSDSCWTFDFEEP